MEFIVVADWYQEYEELVTKFPELNNFNVSKSLYGSLLIQIETLVELKELGKLAMERHGVVLEFDKYGNGNNYLRIQNVNK